MVWPAGKVAFVWAEVAELAGRPAEHGAETGAWWRETWDNSYSGTILGL
jgi:hypothetical protein